VGARGLDTRAGALSRQSCAHGGAASLSESAGPARRPPIAIEGPTGAADAPPASRSDRLLVSRESVFG
jgi:hypothetical protein